MHTNSQLYLCGAYTEFGRSVNQRVVEGPVLLGLDLVNTSDIESMSYCRRNTFS